MTAAVREAGALALKAFGGDQKTWMKSGDSPVSEADLAVDALLRDRLVSATPDFGWLSEESVDDPARLAAPAVWVVDPIDGTRGYPRVNRIGRSRSLWSRTAVPRRRRSWRLRPMNCSLLPSARAPVATVWRLSRPAARVWPARASRRPTGACINSRQSMRKLSRSQRFTRLRYASLGWRRARSMSLSPGATATTGTLRQPIFWCTKRAVRSRLWGAGGDL